MNGCLASLATRLWVPAMLEGWGPPALGRHPSILNAATGDIFQEEGQAASAGAALPWAFSSPGWLGERGSQSCQAAKLDRTGAWAPGSPCRNRLPAICSGPS